MGKIVKKVIAAKLLHYNKKLVKQHLKQMGV